MTTKHIMLNPRIGEHRLKALEWLKTNVEENKWKLEGSFGTRLIFTDKEDEFKFLLANSDLVFIKTKTQEAE